MRRSLRKSLVRPGAAKSRASKSSIAAVVEHAGRDGLRQRRKRLHDAAVERVAQILQRGARHEAGKRGQATAEFAERGPEKDLRLERGVGIVVDEEPIHLRRRDAVGERRGDEAAGRHADVDVELVEVEAVERIGQREQRTDFVDAAERAAAGEREADLRCWRGDAGRLLLGGRRVARLRVRTRNARPEAVLSGIVLLIGVARSLRPRCRARRFRIDEGRLADPFARNGSGDLLLRGAAGLARDALDRLGGALGLRLGAAGRCACLPLPVPRASTSPAA